MPYQHGANRWLEPDEGRLSCPVLRGRRHSNVPLLPDDSGWGMLKRFLQYKGECAGRTVQVVNERNTSRSCSSCGALSGPSGLRQLAVRRWECAHCGEWHDRDVNAARNILRAGSRCGTSVSGNESSPAERPPSQTSCLREAGSDARQAAA